MSESRTPAEILKDTKFVIVQYQSNITAYRYFCFATVEFFNDNDEPSKIPLILFYVIFQ